ncbi:MAG: hypothetical protein SGILL_002864 [Bacillariaceae sp.]
MTVEIPSGNEGEEEVEVKQVEESAPESAPETLKYTKSETVAEKRSKKNLKILLILGTILALAAIAIAVALVPDWGSSSSATTSAVSASSASTTSAENTVQSSDSDAGATETAQDSIGDSGSASSSSSSQGGDPDASDETPSIEDPVSSSPPTMEDLVSTTPPTIEDTLSNTNGSEVLSANKERFFESDEGVFKIKIPLLSENITEPYTSIEEARKDIEQLAKLVVNDAIQQGSTAFIDRVPGGVPEMAFESEAQDDSATGASPGFAGSGGAFADVSDFETYQQEAGVVRSDLVKSNGAFVFAAKSDQIFVWDVRGTLLKTVTMPTINVTDDTGGMGGEPFPMPMDGVFVDEEGVLIDADTGEPVDPDEFMEAEMGDDEEADSDSTTSSTNTAEARSMPMPWTPKPYIEALILGAEGTRLTAIVAGYGAEYWTWLSEEIAPVIQDYKGTRVIVYDIEDDGTLTELSRTDMNGYHLNSYTVGDNVHVVTKTGLNTWDYLEEPMQRWNIQYDEMSDEEYEAAAILLAEELIPLWVNKVMDLYATDSEVLLSRLAVFADSISDDSKTNLQVFGGIAHSITEVNSFDMSASFLTETFDVSTAATLQPGSWGYVYATTDWIWVADNGWRWIKEDGTYVQDTILLGFRLDGSSSTFSAFGTVPGTPLSQFSLDFYKDPETAKEYIRVATTIDFGWGIWLGRPVGVEVTEDENTSRTKNQVIVMEVPSEEGLQIGNQLIERGSVQLGKINERITAVRFFDNLSYVVTFERTDPFYVLDLSDPMNPTVLGELEIPGFSEFMHPITDDNSMLITIGRDADEEGVAGGIQISLFDSTDPTDPQLLDRYLVNQDDNGWSSSGASFDERAFRYIQVEDVGRLIVPVNFYGGWDENGNQISPDKEGFVVFGVDLSKTENIISKEMEIDHTSIRWQDIESLGCYCFESLPERSMLFNGSLMTIKNQNVISTDLVSKTVVWEIDFDTDMFCCGSDDEWLR